MKIVKVNLPANKQSLKAPYALTPKGICIHNTANDATAMAEISYMQSNTQYTSFHFAVDDGQAVQGIELNRSTWHAGDGAGGYANRNLLSIEICFSKSGGVRFTKAEQNAATLCAILCKQYGWTIKNISKHQDYKATACPHRTMALGWQRFLNMVQAEIDALNKPTNPEHGDCVPREEYDAAIQNLELLHGREKDWQRKEQGYLEKLAGIEQLAKV